MSGDLVAAVSHELRQPLASIRGFTEMLLAHWADFPDADKVEMLGQILHDAKRVGRLVDELLEVTRLESGQLVLHPRGTDLGELVARVVANLKLSYPALRVSIEFPDPFPTVMVDPFKLEQVLANVIENACKYGGPGTVRITGAVEPGPGGPVVLAISDSGRGISPDDLPHVTEKFFRAADVATTGAGAQPGGLGLGLWISKGIVEAHGGQLLTTSIAGEGTTVSITIPLQAGAGTGKLSGS
jgi:hypothetical protein